MTHTNPESPNRRPIKTRSSQWAQRSAAFLARSSVTPNQISVASVGFALLGAGLLVGVRRRWVCWAARWPSRGG